MATRKVQTETNHSSQSSHETLGNLHQLAKNEVEGHPNPPASSRWNALLLIEIISCLALAAFALRWYRAQSKSPMPSESQAFIWASFQSAASLSPLPSVSESIEPTATSIPPTPVIIVGPSGIPGIDPQVFIPMVWRGPGGCKSLEEIDFELVSGPVLDPVEGTRLETTEPPEATATWIIHNLSECQWDSLGIYSVYRSLMIQPHVRRGGELFDTVAGLVVANPGETLEISAPFPGDQASVISDEWVLVINGHQLFSKSHLLLNVTNWLVVENPEPKNTNTGGGGSGASSGSSSGQTSPVKQPQRPTESAPVRP